MLYLKNLKKIHIEVSSYCNVYCPLCPRHEKGTTTLRKSLKQNNVTIDQWTKVLDELEQHIEPISPEGAKDVSIDVCGCLGDPAMAPDFFKILSETANRGYKTRTDTNGSLRKSTDWYELGKQLAAAEQKYIIKQSVTFSIDGLEDTNSLYRIGSNWNKIIENAKAFIDGGGRAEWKFIVFKHNEHQIEQAQQLAKDLGFKTFNTFTTTRNLEYKADIENIQKHQPEDKKHIETTVMNSKPVVHNVYKVDTRTKKEIRKNVEKEITKIDVSDNAKKLFNKIVEESDFSTIECDSIKRQALFIDGDFNLWPCAFIASDRVLKPEEIQVLTDEYGVNWNSLNNNSIQDLLNHDYFANKLAWTWNNQNSKFFMTACSDTCKGKIHRKAWNSGADFKSIN